MSLLFELFLYTIIQRHSYLCYCQFNYFLIRVIQNFANSRKFNNIQLHNTFLERFEKSILITKTVRTLNWHYKRSCLYFVAKDTSKSWCRSVLIMNLWCRAFSMAMRALFCTLDGTVKDFQTHQAWGRKHL